MSDLNELLSGLSFGSRTAEEEITGLEHYFVETAQWMRIRSGEKDIVYGPKGAGKSAIYSVLVQRREEFSRQGIIIRSAEQPQGEAAFADIVGDPPQSEAEWRLLWRAYFIVLVAQVLEDEKIESAAAKEVFDGLQRQGLKLDSGRFQGAREFARRMTKPRSLETAAGIDPVAGAKVSAKVEFGADEKKDAVEASVAVASLLRLADLALQEAGLKVWIVLDRLDVAFVDELIEIPALRALMRVYLDFTTFQQVTPKIFMRIDIWDRITEQGFREASHVTRSETISWNRETLLNLVVRRILENGDLCERYGVQPKVVLSDVASQEELFERLFEPPRQLPNGFSDWLDRAIEATGDGLGRSAPRELIHLLDALRVAQLERLQVGHPGPTGEALFEEAAFELAMEEVSRAHLWQTFYTENSKLKAHVEALRGGVARHQLGDLEALWGDSAETTRAVVDSLVAAGVLRRLPRKEGFEIAMLYRPALEVIDEKHQHVGPRDVDT